MHVRLRMVAGHGVDALCGVFGRRRVVRAARFLLHRSRLDLPNHPRLTGEQALPGWLLPAVPADELLTVFDVGANVGHWSRGVLEQVAPTGRRLDLHAFEPAAQTHRRLAANLPAAVRINRLAVSDRTGQTELHVIAPGAGRNSLHDDGTPATVETVPAVTLDQYAERAGIARIHLLKVDTEGHDLQVLRGAARLLRRRAVWAVQFEYNHRWVHSRSFLKDAFDLLVPLGYRIGKVTPRGVEWYPGWDPELETFVEGNYLAGVGPVLRCLPAVRWWKDGAVRCTSV